MKLFQRIEPLLALGIIAAFFMPWVKFFFIAESGFWLATHSRSFSGSDWKTGLFLKLLWLIPIHAARLLIMAYLNKDITDTVKGLGWFPLFMFTIAALGVGVNTIFSILDIGVYITVALSTALLVVAAKKHLTAKALEAESPDDK